PGTGRWWRDPGAARRRSPGRPHRADTAARSPGWTARPGNSRTTATRPSSPGRRPPGRVHRPDSCAGTHPAPRWLPRPTPRTPDRLPAATHACPPASTSADHAAEAESSAARTMLATNWPLTPMPRRLRDRLEHAGRGRTTFGMSGNPADAISIHLWFLVETGQRAYRPIP